MNLRVIGFTLLGVAIVATILAFSTAKQYTPQRPLAYNLQNAYVFRTYSPPLEDDRFPRIDRRGVKLGTALAGTATIGLVGVGLMIFGKKE